MILECHDGHHEHLIGAAVVCSCGKFRGITCVAFVEQDTPPWYCQKCGKQYAAYIRDVSEIPIPIPKPPYRKGWLP